MIDMFEQFTDNARKSMALANQEAQRLKHDYIGVNHVLLGILRNKACTGCAIITQLVPETHRLRLRLETFSVSTPATPTTAATPWRRTCAPAAATAGSRRPTTSAASASAS